MAPYFILLALPAIGALAGARRATLFFSCVFVMYFVAIGFRYQVGMDWTNYVHIYQGQLTRPLLAVLFSQEAAFATLMWLAAQLGGGVIFLNAVSALVFCVGFFLFARRCREPFLAVVSATPLLVIAFAMSGVRQALAMGIIYFVIATWGHRTVFGRVALVIFASLFHFSALFMLIFVALAARVQPAVKVVAIAAITALMGLSIYLDPSAITAYSELYVTGGRKVEAPGAIAQVGIVAAAGLLFFLLRRPFEIVNGDNPLQRQLAVAALVCIPATLVSSVGAYRFVLYLWPVAMYVWSGIPAMIVRPVAAMLYRAVVVSASFAVLLGWLTLANNASAWIPYKSWLVQPEGAPLLKRG